MVEPEGLGAGAKPTPVRECGLEQDIGPNNIGVDEFGGSVDRAVDVALRCQVHDRVGIKAGKNIAHGGTIADVDTAEVVARMALYRSQRREIAGIGQLVEDEHLMTRVIDEMPDDGRSDEPCAARNDDLHAPAPRSYPRSVTTIGIRGWPS